jgi:hypothetical protein
MLVFNNYIYKNKKSKLYFGDRVTVLNDFFYQTGGSIYFAFVLSTKKPKKSVITFLFQFVYLVSFVKFQSTRVFV